MTLLLLTRPYQFFDRGGIQAKFLRDRHKPVDEEYVITKQLPPSTNLAIDKLLQDQAIEEDNIILALTKFLIDD